jgi:cardiolipin hydrolase
MKEEVEYLLQSFQQTLDDNLFSTAEKQSVRQLLEEAVLNDEEKAFLRNRLFELARARTEHGVKSNQFAAVLNWLDSATKTLYKPGPKLLQEAFFSPEDDCVAVINGYLRTVRRTLHLCVFTITDDRISRKILQCHQRGIAVKLISDNEKAFDTGSDIKSLAQGGIEVRIDATPNHMHHKFAIMDEQVVMTGSYNWTRSAAHYNHENILVTNDAAVVARYRDCFENLWPDMEVFSPQ